MTTERLHGESALDYHKRLIYGKLVDKTLADCDYSELAELVYGQPYSSDVARRMFYGSKNTLELLDAERETQIQDNGILAALDAKKAELEQERQRFFDQRREYKKLIAAEGRREHLEQVLTESAAKLRDELGIVFQPAQPSDDRQGETEAVLVFSDWHYGMVASNIYNTYNKEKCVNRVRNVVKQAKAKLKFYHCGVLHLVVLGDLFHGAIHTSARVASEELVCDQLMQSAELLAQAINALSECVPHIVVHMTYGNHGRTVQDKLDSIHRDNMERVIPWWLAQRFYGMDNIEIAQDDGSEILKFNVLGHWIWATHGDLDSVRSAPRLYGTLAHKRYDEDVECILLGDKHHRESFEELGVDAIICGGLCGVDDYANSKRLYSTPSQMMLIVSEQDGIDTECVLRCK